MARFDNKVALINGGAHGQGAAAAQMLVAGDAMVVTGDRCEVAIDGGWVAAT